MDTFVFFGDEGLGLSWWKRRRIYATQGFISWTMRNTIICLRLYSSLQNSMH